MAMVRQTKGVGERTRIRSPIFDKWVPSSGWTEDSNGHYLLVDLPDFKKEEVKLQVDSTGHITVRGERKVHENKYIKFDKTYKVPENSDISEISGKFEGEIFYVTVPKHKMVEKEQIQNVNENINDVAVKNLHEKPNNEESSKKDAPEHENGHECSTDKKEMNENKSDVEGFSKDSIEKRAGEASAFKTAMRMVCKNKRILITVVVAISLGMLVSRKRN